jgi:hypothetical protein
MNLKSIFTGLAIAVFFFSCTKEYSLENGGNASNPLIIGTNCRISQIASIDSASGTGLSSISAVINANDTATRVTRFDSVGNNLLYMSSPQYASDTTFINSDEYFISSLSSGKIIGLHGLYDPTNLMSQFDVDYSYNSSGYLVQKSYTLEMFPGSPVLQVDYTYSGSNLVHMTSTDMTVPELVSDADIDYYTTISPKNYLYLFPDESDNADFNHFSPFSQFFNFGIKPLNAVKKMTVRSYSPGNVVSDSLVSTFDTYIMSRDNYVMSVYLNGDDQPSLPAQAGKLVFSYKCK